MTFWQFVFGIAALGGSFAAGWLVASDKLRAEVFRRRLEVYTEMNRLAGVVLAANVETEVSPPDLPKLLEARVALSRYVFSHVLIISPEVSELANKVVPATDKVDTESIRQALNALLHAMTKELRLREIHEVNAALLNPLRSLAEWKSRKSKH